LARIDAMRDEDIDYSDSPDRGDDEAFWAQAVVWPPTKKQLLSLRVDDDVVQWFRRQGRGYQTRINQVLRTYVAAQRQRTGAGPRLASDPIARAASRTVSAKRKKLTKASK